MATTVAVDGAGQNQTAGHAVISAVAELTDSEATSLEPLYHAVDPEALDSLFDRDDRTTGGPPNRVTFTYCDCEVVVSGDGTVRASTDETEVRTHWR